MKLNTFTTLLILTLSISNLLGQDEKFFDCIPVDYNTNPKKSSSLKNKWLYKDKVLIEGAYIIEDGKSRFLHTNTPSEILTTNNGFFLKKDFYINFYNESTSSVSNTIDTLLILHTAPKKYIEIYNEGLFYLPSEDIIQEERKGRLHFTDGTIESTFYFKEFEAHYDLGGKRDISFIKCGDRFFSTGRIEKNGKESLWELNLENKTANKIKDFYSIGNLFCHNNEKVYFYVGFESSQAEYIKSSNIACFDLNANKSYLLLEDSFDEPFLFSSDFIAKHNDNLILEKDEEIWSLNISNENLELVTTLPSSRTEDFFKVDNYFLLQTDSINNSEYYKNQLLVSDGTVNGTYWHKLEYQDTYNGHWLPLEGYTHNNKIYFSSMVVTQLPYYLQQDLLFEVSEDSLINTGIEIRDLFKVNNHLLFTTGMNYRDDAQKILWNYNNGDPVEIIRFIEPEILEVHLDKLYFIIENKKGKYNFAECDGTIDGTRYVIKNSKNLSVAHF